MKDVRQKAHILCDSIHMNLLEKANLYRQKADWWLSEAEGMGNGNHCFKGSGFPFKVMKIFWNDIKWLLHVINELNATELLTLKC